MLDLLRTIDPTAVGKVTCFDQSAKDVDRSKVDPKPQLAFIDGEHTNKAVLEDQSFCMEAIADDGVILFHDAWIVYPAIFEIHEQLRAHKPEAVPLMLEGSVFGIFLDPGLIPSDPYLQDRYRRNKHYFRNLHVKLAVRKFVPAPLWTLMKKTKDILSGTDRREYSHPKQ